jgi:hypothetical protein
MRVSLLPPWSQDTSSTVKHEFNCLVTEVERAATIIGQNPDVTVAEIAAEFPEIRKRCGDHRIQALIDHAYSPERRFSAWNFCVETLAEVSRYPYDTIKKYLYRETRQQKQRSPGRPPKNK